MNDETANRSSLPLRPSEHNEENATQPAPASTPLPQPAQPPAPRRNTINNPYPQYNTTDTAQQAFHNSPAQHPHEPYNKGAPFAAYHNYQQQHGYQSHASYGRPQSCDQLAEYNAPFMSSVLDASTRLHQSGALAGRQLMYSPHYSASAQSMDELPSSAQPDDQAQKNGGNKGKGKPKPKPNEVPLRAPARDGRRRPRKDPKIMLPAPQPTQEYMAKAAGVPFVLDQPDRKLVILDLNGTLIHRPGNKGPTHLIARPSVKPFLRYLFENFSVMVWSSARPHNVNAIVDNMLGEDLRAMLVACWGRDTFGLSSQHYNQNVQCYKDLTKVWANDVIQKTNLDYELGKRFGQNNTILIDDSALKANAQPHNLIEIPEFTGSQEDMKRDVLREVAAYLSVLKVQDDVSAFMKKDPFKADGRWVFEWEDDTAQDEELSEQVSLESKH